MTENASTADRDPYAVLAREHRLIERGLDVLGRICDELRRTRTLNVPAATKVIDFLRDFADRIHHLKEEEVLFPAIDAKASFPGCGLISEHREGRERVRGVADAVQRSAQGDAEAIRVFLRKARSFIDYLRAHIAKEDDCLASVVAATFSGDEHGRLIQAFDELERREVGTQAFERFAAMVEALEAEYDQRRSTDLNSEGREAKAPKQG